MRIGLGSGLVLLILLALTSCATGGGSGFAREASKERASHTKDQEKDKAEESDDEDDSEEDFDPPTLTIVVHPGNARITINGRFAGTGTATIDSFGFGQKVTITAEAPSHRPRTISVSLWGQTETTELNLEPILGTLRLTSNVNDGTFQAGDTRFAVGDTKVLIGNYEVLARRFGYQDQKHRVLIEEDRTTDLSVEFLPAAFALTDLKSDHREFNPESAAIAATTQFSFMTSAPGHALLVLRDKKGVERARWTFPRLTTWYQEAVWDGRQDGVALPDGNYVVTLTGGAEDGIDTETRTVKVRIDRSLIDKDRSSLGPAAGLLWAPTPEVLSPGTVQASVLALAHVEDWMAHVPVSASVRFSPSHGWEVYGQTSFRFWSDPNLNSLYASFSVKRRIPIDSPDFRLAWIAGGTLGTWLTGDAGIPPTDFLTTFPAVRALLPASWAWGKWTILVAPEIDGSFWSPATAYESASGAEKGFRLWGYGRFGLSYDPGPFSVALSGAARTRSFDQGTGWLAPAHLGLEGKWPVPDTPLTLTSYWSVSAYTSVDYAWYAGIGASLLLPASFTLDLVSRTTNSP